MSLCNRYEWKTLVLSDRGPKSSSARLVACALVEHMGNAGDGAFPSERLLAEETCLERRTVRKALGNLVTWGWLAKEDTGRRGRYGKALSTYSACIPTKGNGPSTVPTKIATNGASIVPIDAKNGSAMGRAWDTTGTLGDPLMGHPVPLNQSITKNQEPIGEERTRAQKESGEEVLRRAATRLQEDGDPPDILARRLNHLWLRSGAKQAMTAEDVKCLLLDAQRG